MNSKEIAKLAGVSRSTVSRVINNYSNVPEKTKEKVLEVIKKYDYVPDASARTLAGMVNKRIGLFVIALNSQLNGQQVLGSHFLSVLMSSVIDYCNKNDYTVVVSIISGAKDYDRAFQLFYDQTISGGVFVGARGDEENIRSLISKGYKVAIVDQNPYEDPKIYEKSVIVNADNYNGAYEATKYLIEMGHTRIAHVMGGKRQYSTTERLRGYNQAIKDAGLENDPGLLYQGNFTFNSGYEATRAITDLAPRPTAIFYANDSMAMGGIQFFSEHKVEIPDDFSIIGFDDIELSRFMKPTLTTVRQNLQIVAQSAIDGVIDMINGGEPDGKVNTIPVDLIIRESCKKI